MSQDINYMGARELISSQHCYELIIVISLYKKNVIRCHYFSAFLKTSKISKIILTRCLKIIFNFMIKSDGNCEIKMNVCKGLPSDEVANLIHDIKLG